MIKGIENNKICFIGDPDVISFTLIILLLFKFLSKYKLNKKVYNKISSSSLLEQKSTFS